MQLSRKYYLLEQFRQGVLLTEIHSPTANVIPAKAMDTIPQFAGRRFDASSLLVYTTHAFIAEPLARRPESPAPKQYSSVPLARGPIEPILQPARLSLTSAKHPRTPSQPPNLQPPPPPILLTNVCTTLGTWHPTDQFSFQHLISSAQNSKINTHYADTPLPCIQNHRHYPDPGTLGSI